MQQEEEWLPRESVKDSVFANGEKTKARAEAQLSIRKQKRQEKLRKGRELTTFDQNSKAPISELLSKYSIDGLVKQQKHEQLAFLRGILQQVDNDELNKLYMTIISPEVLLLLTNLAFGNFAQHSVDALDCLINLTRFEHHFELRQADALYNKCGFLDKFLQRLQAPVEPTPDFEHKMWVCLSNIMCICHATTEDVMMHPLMRQHFFARANRLQQEGERAHGMFSVICVILRRSHYSATKPLPFDLGFAKIAARLLKEYFFKMQVENPNAYDDSFAEVAIDCVSRIRNAFAYFSKSGAEQLLEAIDARAFLVKVKGMYMACGSDLRNRLPKKTLIDVQFTCIEFLKTFLGCLFPLEFFDVSDFVKQCGALQLIKMACQHMADSAIRKNGLIAYANYLSGGFKYIVDELDQGGLFNLIRSSIESSSMPIKEAASFIVVQVVIICQKEQEHRMAAQNVLRRLVCGDKVLTTIAQLLDVERTENYSLAADAVMCIYYCIKWDKETTLKALYEAVEDPEELMFRISALAHHVKSTDVGDNDVHIKLMGFSERLLEILHEQSSIMDLSEYDNEGLAGGDPNVYVSHFAAEPPRSDGPFEF